MKPIRQVAVTTLSALVLGCVGLAAVLTAPSAAAEQGATAFTIRSSLDGKTVLPHRIRWIAYPSAPVLFPGVEFLIDGKVVFANRTGPVRVRRRRPRRGHENGEDRLPRHVLARAGEAPVHRPRKGAHRRQENNRHEHGRGASGPPAGAARAAHWNVEAHAHDRCAARQERAVPGRHGPAGSVPDHGRPALHPHERPGSPQAPQDRLRRRPRNDHHPRPRLDGRSGRGRRVRPVGPGGDLLVVRERRHADARAGEHCRCVQAARRDRHRRVDAREAERKSKRPIEGGRNRC